MSIPIMSHPFGQLLQKSNDVRVCTCVVSATQRKNAGGTVVRRANGERHTEAEDLHCDRARAGAPVVPYFQIQRPLAN